MGLNGKARYIGLNNVYGDFRYQEFRLEYNIDFEETTVEFNPKLNARRVRSFAKRTRRRVKSA